MNSENGNDQGGTAAARAPSPGDPGGGGGEGRGRSGRRGGSRRRRRRGKGGGGVAAAAAPAHDDAESVAELPAGPASPISDAARRIGIRRLHPEQERGIESVLAERDVLLVLPTGFGKSACYQIPSMLLPSPVLMISPLLALLRDQHEKLLKHGIPCVRLDGTVRGKARREALERIAGGGSLLVMTTPETLQSDDAFAALSDCGVALAAIDEAHCISEWGYDFRPAYLRLGERLRALGGPPILALTATATENVRKDIVRFLLMRDPVMVTSSPHRSNLAFEVIECQNAARLRALVRLSQRLRRPGIIYCTTTKEVDIVYAVLAKLGIPAHRYHGKMTAAERNQQQELFMKNGRRTVMVATSAFGLGIDKQDMRFVVHQQSPASLEQYVQEAGRAGRDGQKANCILLYDPADRETHEVLLSRSRLRPDQLFRLGAALSAWAGEGRKPELDALALSAELSSRATMALLTPIEEAGIARLADSEIEVLVPADQVVEQVRGLASQFQTMRTQDSRRLESVADYARGTGCRAIDLRTYFGEEPGRPCGLCDVCRGRPDRPDSFWQPVALKPRRGDAKRNKRGRKARGGPSTPRPPGRGAQVAPGGEAAAGAGAGRGRRRRRGRGGAARGGAGKPPLAGAPGTPGAADSAPAGAPGPVPASAPPRGSEPTT